MSIILLICFNNFCSVMFFMYLRILLFWNKFSGICKGKRVLVFYSFWFIVFRKRIGWGIGNFDEVLKSLCKELIKVCCVERLDVV